MTRLSLATLAALWAAHRIMAGQNHVERTDSNPLIWVQFLEGDGELIDQPTFLGRCNQL